MPQVSGWWCPVGPESRKKHKNDGQVVVRTLSRLERKDVAGKVFRPGPLPHHEGGWVQKDFIECGSTVWPTKACVRQVWVANDDDHPLDTTKLASIMRIANPLLQSDELPVEVEYEEGATCQYLIGGMDVTPPGRLFFLGTKQAACLAPEKCNVGDTGCSGRSRDLPFTQSADATNVFALKSPLRRTQNKGTSNGTQPVNRLVAARDP